MPPNQKNYSLLQQFIHFAAVGLTGTIVQYICLWIGVEVILISAPAASGIGYILGAICNYLLNYFFTFNSKKSHKEAASKYFFILGIGWWINVGLMNLFVDYFNWYYWIAQFITTGIGLIWNFSGSKWWAFRKQVTGNRA